MQIAYSPCRRRQRFIGGSTSPDGIFSAIFAHGLLRRQRPDTSFCGKGAASYPVLRHRNAQQLPREGGYLPRNDYICKRGIREERPGPLRRTAKDGGKEKAPGKGGMRSRAARAESREQMRGANGCDTQTNTTKGRHAAPDNAHAPRTGSRRIYIHIEYDITETSIKTWISRNS